MGRIVVAVAGRCRETGGEGWGLAFADRRPGEPLTDVFPRRWMSSGPPRIGDVIRETKWGFERVKPKLEDATCP